MSAARATRRARTSAIATPRRGAGDAGASWKPAAAVVIVLTVALWPLAHRGLVAVTGANPWKLGGFAMYAAPAPPLGIALYGLRDGQLAKVDPATLPVHVREALRRFEIERHALGELRRPDAIARDVLAALPGVSQLSIVVQRTTLRPGDARLAIDRIQYSYDREGPRTTRRIPPAQTRTSTTIPK